MRRTTIEALQNARVEKDVENAYRAEINHHRPAASITSPHHTDGHAQWGHVRLLLEAKFDQDLKSRAPVCNVLGQLLLYVKRFEAAGDALPNVLLVGDKNECFVLATSAVAHFLSLPVDWSVAPSAGSPALTRALVEGVNLLPYVYDVDGNLDFRAVLAKVETLAAGEQHTVRATAANLGAIFLYWIDRVFSDKNLTPTEQVDVFLRCLFQPMDVYLHPNRRGVLVVPGYPGVLVNAEQYQSFFDHFAQGYKPSEVEAFYAMKDRLVEDDTRRRQGAFFTPRLWVDAAHAELDRVLGANWRKDCVVWDPAAGTANLTRDYQDWGDLLVSTAERADVQVVLDQRWHESASVFQYDFLNPEEPSLFFGAGEKNALPLSVAERLRAAARAGKRIVFLMNPPYGTANNAGATGTSKAGIAQTAVSRQMKQDNLGACTQQLYAQFMYRCAELAREYRFLDFTVALFSVPTFMSSGSYAKLRRYWYARLAYQKGFLFQASHFSDVSGRWGVAFTVWNSGGATKATANLALDLRDVRDFVVETVGQKQVYNSDGRDASSWVREGVTGKGSVDAPQLSSGLVVKQVGYSTLAPDATGYVMLKGNNLMESASGVAWVSAGYSNGHGFSVLPANWRRAVALFSARKLVQETWATQKDEYLRPDEAAPGYEQWVNDCHIYALLHSANNCTAMRDVTYRGKSWRIKNHWFWRSKAAAIAALDTAATPTLYRDCAQEAEDPYFARVIPSLSLDAEALFLALDALWVKSLPVRESYAAGRPDLHLTAWDAGVYQAKYLWRDLYLDEWRAVQEKHRRLAERLQEGAYAYGFLRK